MFSSSAPRALNQRMQNKQNAFKERNKWLSWEETSKALTGREARKQQLRLEGTGCGGASCWASCCSRCGCQRWVLIWGRREFILMEWKQTHTSCDVGEKNKTNPSMVECQRGCRKSDSVSDNERHFNSSLGRCTDVAGFSRDSPAPGWGLFWWGLFCRLPCQTRCFKINLVRTSVADQISTILHVSCQMCWCSLPADGHHGGRIPAALMAGRWFGPANTSRHGSVNPESQSKSCVLLTWNRLLLLICLELSAIELG